MPTPDILPAKQDSLQYPICTSNQPDPDHRARTNLPDVSKHFCRQPLSAHSDIINAVVQCLKTLYHSIH